MPEDTEYETYKTAMQSLRGAKETSARAFYSGLRHRKRHIWIGSKTVLDGAELCEELRRPVGNEIFLSVDLNNRPVAPDPYTPGDRHG